MVQTAMETSRGRLNNGLVLCIDAGISCLSVIYKMVVGWSFSDIGRC